ncbi:zinc ribbon domain-containing protein, partial [Frankia sp. R82]|nr:zinc ribbon domain-containing protein [Frankia sp. R82]
GGGMSGGTLPRRRPAGFPPPPTASGPLPTRDDPAASADPHDPADPTTMPPGPATGPTPASYFAPAGPAGPADTAVASGTAVPLGSVVPTGTVASAGMAAAPVEGMPPSEAMAMALAPTGSTGSTTGPLPEVPPVAVAGGGADPNTASTLGATEAIGIARAFGAGATFTAAARPGTATSGESAPGGSVLPTVTYSVSRSGWRRRTMRVQVHTSGPVGELVLYARPGTAPPRAAAEAHELSRLAAVDQAVTRTIDVTLDGAQLPWGVRLLPALHPSGWAVAQPADEDLVVR